MPGLDLRPASGATSSDVTAEAAARAAADALLAPLASPTFTGTVVLPEGNDAAAATASRRTLGLTGNKAMPGTATLDQIAAPAANLSFAGFKATLLGKATAATDAAQFGQDADAYQMKQRGLIAENFPLAAANQALVCVSQSLYQLKIWLPQGTNSVTGIVIAITTAGSTLTSSQNLCTLYDSAGTLKGSTADQSAVWTTAGAYAMALGGGPYSMAGGDGSYCYVTVLSNGTTPATMATGPNRFAMNAASTGQLSGAALMAGRNGTAITAAPSPLVPGNAVVTSANSIWIGLY